MPNSRKYKAAGSGLFLVATLQNTYLTPFEIGRRNVLVHRRASHASCLEGNFKYGLNGVFNLIDEFDVARVKQASVGNEAEFFGFARALQANCNLVKTHSIKHCPELADVSVFGNPGANGYSDFPPLVDELMQPIQLLCSIAHGT